MAVENKERANFGNSALRTIYDMDLIAIESAEALKAVLTEIDELENLNELKVLENRHRHFQVPNTKPDDYKERFLEITPGKFALVGIRHVSGEKNRPFVHLFLGFEPSHEDLDLLKKIALTNFEMFSPKHISFWLRPSAMMSHKLEDQGFAAGRYIVGSIPEISKMDRPQGYERISLEKMSTMSDSKWYQNAYAEFHKSNPELASWVTITDEEDLESCAKDGLLYRVLVDGIFAGLIGAQSELLLGRPAIYMTELLLVSPFKGKGLAQALQRKFLDLLDSNFEFVWGTIDARNLPSTRTALKIGRRPIRTEFFVPL